jgi:hypothetical protein
MAIGVPLLVAWWGDGYLRSFEWIPSTQEFVQVAARNGWPQAVGIPYEPNLWWAIDGQQIGLSVNDDLEAGYAYALTPLLLDMALPSVIFAGFAGVDAYFTGDFSTTTDRILYGFDRGRTGISYKSRLNDYTFPESSIPYDPADPTEFPPMTQPRGLTSVAQSPDGSCVVFAYALPDHPRYWVRTGFDISNFPEYEGLGFIDSQLDVGFVKFSTDNRYLIVADRSGPCEIWGRSGSLLDFMQPLAALPGTFVTAEFSNDKRHLAVSWLNGSTYSTRLFFRSGAYYTPKLDIPGMGKLLSFSYDGSMLIDAGTRNLWTLDIDTWSEVPNAMNNVDLNARVQAVSPHWLQPVSFGMLYDHAINKFKNDIVDLDNLRLTLLDSNAIFTQTDSTFLQATNNWTWNVSSGGYPAEGMPITFIDEEDLASKYVWHVEAVTRDIVVDPLIARYALIYDDSDVDDGPLIFIDLGAERSIPRNTKLTLEFRLNEMLAFRS